MEISLSELKKPFHPNDIEWRVQSDGIKDGKVWCRVLAYVDARAVMDRLDDVVGAENWKDEYIHLADGVLCKLSIRIDGEWVTKMNGSPETAVESFKGGISKALVRTASTWGIGRYLYQLTASFGNVNENGKHYQGGNKDKGIPAYKWDEPTLPSWALPDGVKQESKPAPEKKETVDRLTTLPEDITAFFKAQKFTKGEAREFCNIHEWDVDAMRFEINQQENPPA